MIVVNHMLGSAVYNGCDSGGLLGGYLQVAKGGLVGWVRVKQLLVCEG